jgi:hypothetical protein
MLAAALGFNLPNNLPHSLGSLLSITANLFETLNICALLPFSFFQNAYKITFYYNFVSRMNGYGGGKIVS